MCVYWCIYDIWRRTGDLNQFKDFKKLIQVLKHMLILRWQSNISIKVTVESHEGSLLAAPIQLPQPFAMRNCLRIASSRAVESSHKSCCTHMCNHIFACQICQMLNQAINNFTMALRGCHVFRGVAPSSELLPVPCWTKQQTISMWPFAATLNRGVALCWSVMFLSAPCWIKRRTISMWPFWAATCCPVLSQKRALVFGRVNQESNKTPIWPL